MRQYTIDELRPGEYDILKTCLDDRYLHASIGDIYWIPVPEALLSERQARHTDCAPLVVAVHLEAERLSCEFLLRTRSAMRCDCMAYANTAQRNWIIDTIDTLFSDCGIQT
ncbi:MAG: hypothetical protein CSA22_03265 [Deltaproteobacteria bacterium]|nr:MAG: hypothetical protein CSA22_03265 [Deltaproteobacteria bacterium]